MERHVLFRTAGLMLYGYLPTHGLVGWFIERVRVQVHHSVDTEQQLRTAGHKPKALAPAAFRGLHSS